MPVDEGSGSALGTGARMRRGTRRRSGRIRAAHAASGRFAALVGEPVVDRVDGRAVDPGARGHGPDSDLTRRPWPLRAGMRVQPVGTVTVLPQRLPSVHQPAWQTSFRPVALTQPGKGKTIMKRTGSIARSIVVAALLLLASSGAFAQATRTWVSGVGDDVNPCSRTAPCKTFAGAISKTAAGGLINCLDPGGYGTVTITKSITIACKHVEGSTLNSGGINGFVINDFQGLGIEVVLRGVEIDGSGSTPGLNGIRFINGTSLLVEDVVIRDSENGNGIHIANSSGNARIHIINSSISGTGNGSVGAGIQVAPTGSAGAHVTITNTTLTNNTVGIRADSNGTTGQVHVTVTDSTVTGSTYHGFVALGSTGLVRMMLNGVVAANNGGEGVRAAGGTAAIRIGDSVVTNNSVGLARANSGQILSYGNNQINGNGTDGTAGVATLR